MEGSTSERSAKALSDMRSGVRAGPWLRKKGHLMMGATSFSSSVAGLSMAGVGAPRFRAVARLTLLLELDGPSACGGLGHKHPCQAGSGGCGLNRVSREEAQPAFWSNEWDLMLRSRSRCMGCGRSVDVGHQYVEGILTHQKNQ
jgi:hypothetical protein